MDSLSSTPADVMPAHDRNVQFYFGRVEPELELCPPPWSINGNSSRGALSTPSTRVSIYLLD